MTPELLESASALTIVFTARILCYRTLCLSGKVLLSWLINAVFTEEDFVSISRIGGSGKHGQAWKTGRFGVGFNSVYHLTDIPSFVSGKYVVLFDPQGAYLPNISAANPGKRIDFLKHSHVEFYICDLPKNKVDAFNKTNAVLMSML